MTLRSNYLTALPLLLTLFVTGCYTRYRAPGAVGKVVDARTGAPVQGACIVRPATSPPASFEEASAATVVTDKDGAFNLPPDSHTQIRFMYLRNPESLSGAFIISAHGYATNELRGTATSHTFWRAELGKILLTAVGSAGASKVDSALLTAAQKAMPREVTTNELIRALELGLWNSNRTAVAVSITQQPRASVIFVIIRQTNGTYIATDASRVEDGNFGKLGRPRTDYERFETTPTEWLHRKDGWFQVRMRTQAWKAGQRYTVSEPLLIKPDGRVLYR